MPRINRAGGPTLTDLLRTLRADVDRALARPFQPPRRSADPASPRDGDMWINTTTGQLKIRVNGVVRTVTLT